MFALYVSSQFAALICILVFFWKTRVTPLNSLGGLVIVAMWIYHGLPEVLGALFSGYNDYRKNLTWDLSVYASSLACAGMIVFCVAYMVHHKREPASRKQEFNWIQVLPDGIFLSVLAFAAVGLSFFTSGAELSYSFGAQLLVYCSIPLAAMCIVRVTAEGGRYIRSLFIVLLLALSILCLSQASRWLIVFALALPIGLARYTCVYRKNDVLLIVTTLGALMVFVLTITRSELGYEFFKSQKTKGKIEALGKTTFDSGVLLENTVYRCDGNSTIGHIISGFSEGVNPAALETLRGTAILLIPRILYPQKPGEGEEIMMREKSILAYHFNFPQGDNIVSTLGALLAYFGLWLFIPLVYCWGWALARIDLWLARRRTIGGIFIFTYLFWSISLFEQGIEPYFMILRNFVPLFVIFLVYIKVRSLFGAQNRVQKWKSVP